MHANEVFTAPEKSSTMQQYNEPSEQISFLNDSSIKKDKAVRINETKEKSLLTHQSIAIGSPHELSNEVRLM